MRTMASKEGQVWLQWPEDGTLEALRARLACWPDLLVSPAHGDVDLLDKWEAAAGVFDPNVKQTERDFWRFEAYVAHQSTVDLAVLTYALFYRGIPCVVAAEGTARLSSAIRNHPLFLQVHCGSTNAAEVLEATVKSYFGSVLGRVFVLEGGDGAGKQTQTALLVERCRKEGYPVATLDFPNDKARYGVLIREILQGHKGPLKAVSPQIFAALYGLNRHDTMPRLKMWLRQGKNVVLDRYMSANFGHQASKYEKDDERIAAIHSLKAFEEVWLGLPGAHNVIYLNLPPEVAFLAMQQDGTRKALDLHEQASMDYKNNVRRAFLWCCGHLAGWHEIRCCTGEAASEVAPASGQPAEYGARRSREEIHNQVFGLLRAELVNGPQP